MRQKDARWCDLWWFTCIIIMNMRCFYCSQLAQAKQPPRKHLWLSILLLTLDTLHICWEGRTVNQTVTVWCPSVKAKGQKALFWVDDKRSDNESNIQKVTQKLFFPIKNEVRYKENGRWWVWRRRRGSSCTAISLLELPAAACWGCPECLCTQEETWQANRRKVRVLSHFSLIASLLRWHKIL